MNILILGGTADGRRLTALLHQRYNSHCEERSDVTTSFRQGADPGRLPRDARNDGGSNISSDGGLKLIYSVAGLVRQPQVPATVISGGFTQFGGMAAYCKTQAISAIIDATHPYATQIGATARRTATQMKLGYWRFLRPAWQAKTTDKWHNFAQRQELILAMAAYQRILLTLGQVSSEELQQLSQVEQVWLRTAVQPAFDLPANVHWIKAIGPFDLAHEHALLQDKGIQAMASKNSGGDATSAKLQAASQLNIPVYMLDRPAARGDEYDQFETLLCQLQNWQQQGNKL